MHTTCERHVLSGVGSIHPEFGRAIEVRRVPIRRARQQHDLRARRDVDPRQAGGDARESEVALDRAFQPKHLFDEIGDAVTVVAQRVLQFGILGQYVQGAGEQARGGLVTGDEQECGDPDYIDDFGQGSVGEMLRRQFGQDVQALGVSRRSPM